MWAQDKDFGRFTEDKVKALLGKVYETEAQIKDACSEIQKEARLELVAGNWDKGGAVTFVLDMAVTDDMDGEVHEMLHMLPEFDNNQLDECPDTGPIPHRHARTGTLRLSVCL